MMKAVKKVYEDSLERADLKECRMGEKKMDNLIERLRGAATCVYLATGKDQADALSKILHEAAEALSEAEAELERRLARIMQLGPDEYEERNRRDL